MVEDIPLEHDEKKEKIGILRGTKFENFVFDDHNINVYGKPRHGLTKEKIKEIYYKFDNIIDAFKRPNGDRFRYCFLYRINKNLNYYLIFMLDERPMRLYDAYSVGKNIQKRLFRKYLGYFNRK